MRQLLTLASAFVFLLVLSACGGQDTETAVPPDPEPFPEETQPADERTEPVEPTPPAVTQDTLPEQGVMPPIVEHDERLTEDGQEVHWWDDDELAEKLGLEPEQRTRLLEAREALHDARVEGRARLAEQRDLEAEVAGDAERLGELRESAGRIDEELEAAEAGWQVTVRTILTPEQYAEIADLIER